MRTLALPMSNEKLAAAKHATITVGEGRGFLVRTHALHRDTLVITAAHCLPHLPSPFSDAEERTYANLLGSLDEPPTVDAECKFVDPIADLAVLTSVDDQERPTQAEAYAHLMASRPALRLGGIRRRSSAWLLTLQNQWETCTVDVGGLGTLTLVDAHVVGGMSGSPIVTAQGSAVGVVSVGAARVEGDGREEVEQREQHGQPSLASTLPGWLLAQLWPSLDEQRAWDAYLRRSGSV